MKANYRLIIFVLVILAVGVIFTVPYLNQETNKSLVTPDPVNRLARAAAEGKPVFLEFYSPQ